MDAAPALYPEPELERDSRSLLDGAELVRARAMTPRTREDFLHGRLAQRRFAAGLLGVPASDLTAWYSCPRCGTGADISHGRPGYLLRGQAAPLLLSLSRAAGWTLLAGVVDPDPGEHLGIDVEDPARADFDGFDDVVLTPAEQRHLAGLDGIALLRGGRGCGRARRPGSKCWAPGCRRPRTPWTCWRRTVNGRAGLRDLPPAETGLPADLVAAVALAVLP